MDYKYPKCISKNCPVELKCDRKINGEESQLVDYDRVDTGKGKCEWFINLREEEVEVVNNGEDSIREAEAMDGRAEVKNEE